MQKEIAGPLIPKLLRIFKSSQDGEYMEIWGEWCIMGSSTLLPTYLTLSSLPPGHSSAKSFYDKSVNIAHFGHPLCIIQRTTHSINLCSNMLRSSSFLFQPQRVLRCVAYSPIHADQTFSLFLAFCCYNRVTVN